MSLSPERISVVICCHNSSKRLPQTLEHLASQIADPALWEVTVVDNASTDGTAEVAQALWKRFESEVPFRVVHESRPGLRHARIRGADSSRHDIIAFVDDDNWLAPDWIMLAAEAVRNCPRAGIIGTGQITPVFETDGPAWNADFLGVLACTSTPARTLSVLPKGSVVAGAGMIVRREAFNSMRAHYGDCVSVGRSGKHVSGGDDIEMCYVISLLGWRVALDGRLRMQHFLPDSRFDKRYLQRLLRGNAFSSNQMDPLRRLATERRLYVWPGGTVIMYLQQVLANGVQVVVHVLRYGKSIGRSEHVAHALFLHSRVSQFLNIFPQAPEYFRTASQVRGLLGLAGAAQTRCGLADAIHEEAGC